MGEGRTQHYEAVVCDDDGVEIPGGKSHRVVTNAWGEAQAGTCPVVRAHNSWFFEATWVDSPRLPCKRCHTEAPDTP